MYRILILDDDPDYGNRLASALKRKSPVDQPYHVQAGHEIDAVLNEAQQAENAGQPYDVFLIDQKLGPGPDGIEVMEQLFKISPRSKAIIFTGLEDPNDGMRATQAGAYKYLQKFIKAEELLMHINALREAQKTERERDWLQIFSQIAEQSLGSVSYESTAETLSQGALRFGFDRASLFRCSPEAPETLIGVCQAGKNLLDSFSGSHYSIHSWDYFLKASQAPSIAIFEAAGAPHFSSPAARPGAQQGLASQESTGGALLPLWIGNQFVGVMVLENFSTRRHFQTEEPEQLQLLARIAAGNLERVRLYEAENADRRRLALLQSASEKLLDIVNQDEEKFWRTLLTLATANYALGFNRAWVFLAEAGGARLCGMLGIGHLDAERAEADWKRDKAERMNFQSFLEALNNGGLRRTPLEKLTRGWTIELAEDGDGFQEALTNSRRVIYSEPESRRQLPKAFIKRFKPGPCAILPLRAGAVTLGVVAVDNKHNRQPINPTLLDRLETFLNIAGLAWQDHRQNKEREALLEAAYAVMGNVGADPLGKTLRKICAAARTVTGADAVVVYPLISSSEPYIYDVANIGAAGKVQIGSVKDKPRQKSVSAQILRSGPLVVNDIQGEADTGGLMDLSRHSFIRREGVRAMIGVPVTGIEENQSLGVLFLNYRAPQHFTSQERKQAEAFANLASIAILNTRNAEEARRSLETAWSHDEQSQRELSILYQVQKEALTHVSEEWLTRTLLYNLKEMLKQDGVDPALILRHWDHQIWDHEPIEDSICYRLDAENRPVRAALPKEDQIPIGELFEGRDEWRDASNGQTYTAIRLADAVIGALRVTLQDDRSAQIFQPILRRFASAAAMAIDNARRQEHLLGVLQAAKTESTAVNLQRTFEDIIRAARQVSPDMSALTLWHRDPETGELRLAQTFGLRNIDAIEAVNPSRENLVWRVMALAEPVWLSDPDPNHWLVNRFIAREGVISTAAFPLRANQEDIGAMFFNYRRKHVFSEEEKVIFKILAEVAAASIRDAQQLETEKKKSRRLQALLDTSMVTGATQDINDLFGQILASLSATFPNTIPCLLTYNRDEHTLEFTEASKANYPIDNPALTNWASLPIDRPTIACRVARQTITDGRIVSANVGDVRADGDYFPAIRSTLSELCVSLCGSAGDLLGVLLLERDRVDGFEPEDQVLAIAIAQQISLAIERARQNAELNFSQTVAAWTAWAADLAHDFNRSLSTIRLRAYLLRKTADQVTPEEIRTYAQEIEADVAEISAGNPGEEPSHWIEPDRIITEWADEVRAKRSGELAVTTDLNCPGVYIHSNTAAFRRVLRHLERNALMALENQQDGEISLHTRKANNHFIEIVFADNGPGVPGHLRGQVLLQPIGRGQKPGGYGLLLTRQIVKNMDGAIRLLPKREHCGAEFLIRLPISSPLEATADIRPAAAGTAYDATLQRES